MSTGRLTPEFLEELSKEKMLPLIIGITISSDNNNTITECREHIEWLKEMGESMRVANIENKEKYLDKISNGIDILNADIDDFENKLSNDDEGPYDVF